MEGIKNREKSSFAFSKVSAFYSIQKKSKPNQENILLSLRRHEALDLGSRPVRLLSRGFFVGSDNKNINKVVESKIKTLEKNIWFLTMVPFSRMFLLLSSCLTIEKDTISFLLIIVTSKKRLKTPPDKIITEGPDAALISIKSGIDFIKKERINKGRQIRKS